MSGSEPERPKSAHKLWLVVPTIVVALAMLQGRHGWLAMFAFHGTMIVALLVHRRRMNWKRQLRLPVAKILISHIALALLACSAVSWAIFAYANRYGGYGLVLDSQLTSYAVPGATRIWFAAQLCLLNPLLEELFWRGLFFSDRKRPAATDFCYAAFHFFALQPFVPAWQAGAATVALVGFGYFLRQLARQQNGSIVVPLVWHVLGDLAVVVAIAEVDGVRRHKFTRTRVRRL